MEQHVTLHWVLQAIGHGVVLHTVAQICRFIICIVCQNLQHFKKIMFFCSLLTQFLQESSATNVFVQRKATHKCSLFS